MWRQISSTLREPHSLHNFKEVAEAFLTQYASRWEAKKNNHHLFSVKMRQSDNLESYIDFFQNQLVKIPNCGEDVSALAFISEMQVSHPLYKHLLKHNVTQMSEVLSPTQLYIKLEEATKTSFNHTTKYGDDGGKSKSSHKAFAMPKIVATCLQKTGALHPFSKFSPNL